MCGLSGSEDWNQAFVHGEQVLHQLNYPSSP